PTPDRQQTRLQPVGRAGSPPDLKHHTVWLHSDRHHFHGVARIPQRPAAFQLELPTVPGAREHGRFLVDLHRARRLAAQPSADDAEADGSALVRTAVVDRIEPVMPPQDAHLVLARGHYPEPAVFKIRDRTYADPHLAFSSTALVSSTSSSFQP